MCDLFTEARVWLRDSIFLILEISRWLRLGALLVVQLNNIIVLLHEVGELIDRAMNLRRVIPGKISILDT